MSTESGSTCPSCERLLAEMNTLDETIARLRTELATLREDLAHLTSDAGPDSCADQVTRRLAAEAELARATDLARTSASCAAERARRVTELEAEIARVTKERDLFERDAETAYDKAWADLRAQLAESNRERDALHWVAKVFSGLLMDAADIPVPDMYDAKAVREALHTLLRQRDEARAMVSHALDFDMDREQASSWPLCILCGGRKTRWSPEEHGSPSETVYCFDCNAQPLMVADRLIAERARNDEG